MTPKLLLRWMPDPQDRRYDILTVYRIERNRYGVLVYRIVERVDNPLNRTDLNDRAQYARGFSCAHNRSVMQSPDLCHAAGLDVNTPDGIVDDWWDEFVPPTHKQWQRGQRRAAREQQVPS